MTFLTFLFAANITWFEPGLVIDRITTGLKMSTTLLAQPSNNECRKPFTVFWKSGECELLYGVDQRDAIIAAGYSLEALRAVDFCSPGNRLDDFIYCFKERRWCVYEK